MPPRPKGKSKPGPVVPLSDEQTLRQAAEAAQGLLPGKRPRMAEVLPVRLAVPSAVEFEDPIWSGEVRDHQSMEVRSTGANWPIHKSHRDRYNWVTPNGRGGTGGITQTFTTDPSKMQVLPRRVEDSQNTCDICGKTCTQVLYEFRCYPKLDHLTDQERHTGVRMLDPFVAYIGKTCGEGLLGCRTSTSVIREWIRGDLLSKPLEEAEKLILALEPAERLATMNELRKQAGFEGPGKMQRKATPPRPLGLPGEMMVGLRDKEDLQISVDPAPGMSLQDHVLKTLLAITWPDCVSRANVIPEGQQSIKAMCFGATQPRFRNQLTLAVTSRRMQRLTRLLCMLGRREIPEEEFPWTSVQANKDYAARFHRDKNNLGPSWIIAKGDFTGGGELFIADEGQFDREEGGIDHEITLGEKVPSGYVPGQVVKGKLFDIRNRWQRFDGRYGHMAMPFTSGTRISLVFFTRREAFDRMPDDLAEVLADMGFRMPDNKWFDETREPLKQRHLKQPRLLEPAPEPDSSDDEAEDGSEALEGQPIKDLERFPSEMKVDWRSLKLSIGVVSCNAGPAAAMALQELLPAGTTKASVVYDSDAMIRWAKNFKATQGFKDYKVLDGGKATCHVQNKKEERLMADEHIFHGSFEIWDLMPYFQLEERPHLRGLGDDSSVSAKAFRAIQAHLKQKPPVVLLEVPDWEKCPQQQGRAMKFLTTNLLSYDYYHGRCVAMDLPEPLSGSSRLMIFLVRKDIMSGQKLLQTVQLAKYLLLKLPARQVELLDETISSPEKPPIGANVNRDGEYRDHLRARQPDHWLLQEPWSKYLKRLNQVCKQAKAEKVDWSRILVDLGEQTIWSDDGQLPNAASAWHYSLAKHRLLRGDEELLCRGYPCEMALLRHLTDDQRRHLAACSSSSVQLLGACLAALLSMSDWISFSPALQALTFQGELPDLSAISCEEPTCSELNVEDESQVIQNNAVLCYSLLQRLVEQKPKSKGKKSTLDKAVQNAMKDRAKEIKGNKEGLSEEQEADSLMRSFDDEIVDLADRKRKLTYYYSRTVGCLPFDHAMSWTFQAAMEGHDQKDVAQEVINAGLLYMNECVSLVIRQDGKERKHSNKLDKNLTGLDKYHGEFLKGLESKSRAWPENLREAFLNFKHYSLVRFFLRGDFAQQPVEEYVANIMPVVAVSGIGRALMKVLENVSSCWGDKEWAPKFSSCGGFKELTRILIKVAEAALPVQKKMLQKFSSEAFRLASTSDLSPFLRAALQLASNMKDDTFFNKLEAETVTRSIDLLQKPNREEAVLFLKDLHQPRFQWTAEFLRVLEDVKKDLAALRMDKAEIENLHELLNRIRSTTAQRPTEAKEIWKALSRVEDSLGTTVEEDLQTRLKVAEEKQRQEKEAESFARRQEAMQSMRQQAQAAFGRLRTFLVFEEYPGGERKPRLRDRQLNESYLKAQQECVALMRVFQTDKDLGGLEEEEQQILQQSKEAVKHRMEAPAVLHRQKSVLLENSLPLCLVEILEKVGLLPRLPELTSTLLDDHRFLPGGVKAILLRYLQEGKFKAENLEPQLPGGWKKRISNTYDFEYFCHSNDAQTSFEWPMQELPAEHRPWPHEPRHLQRHQEESAKYLLSYTNPDGSEERWCYLCNASAPKEHLGSPQHMGMRQEWRQGCEVLKQFCQDFAKARLDEACAGRPSLAEDILKLWRWEAVNRFKRLARILPAFWHLILEPWEDSRSADDLQRGLNRQLQRAQLEEPARVPEPELPQPGRDFPDLSSGNPFLDGQCVCCNQSVSDSERATHSQSKTHDSYLKSSLYAFQIIKERGDQLWRHGMRFEAGKVKCACTKEVNWWEIGSWFDCDPPHVNTNNHKKWLRNTEDPPPTEAMPWEEARRQRWLASFAPLAPPEADPAAPATPETKRRRTEVQRGEPEAEPAEVSASAPNCKSMARAAEFALEPPTTADIENGTKECCEKRGFPKLQGPLCYGWSSFKKTRKEAWLFCATCKVWVGAASLTVASSRWTYRLDPAEDALGACEHYSSARMRDLFAKNST